VNIAQRIENVAKESMTAADEVVVLVSEAVLQSAGSSIGATQSIGRFTLRGRHEQTEILKLF
jgi:class 3 adenylate cyclase